MRFSGRSRHSAVLTIAMACSLAAGSPAFAQSTEYEVRTFEGGPAWFVYDDTVDLALHVLHPNDPKCHEVGEIILLFESRDQLRDDSLIEAAALAGMSRYAELCRSLGANPSNQRKVAGLIIGAGEPDSQGRVMGDARVLDAMVASFTGNYQVRVRRNAVAADGRDDPAAAIIAERDRKLAAQQAERETADQALEEERGAHRHLVWQSSGVRERASHPVRARRNGHGRMVAGVGREHWSRAMANRTVGAARRHGHHELRPSRRI
jgi:hypothetical protein